MGIKYFAFNNTLESKRTSVFTFNLSESNLSELIIYSTCFISGGQDCFPYIVINAKFS